MFEENTEEVPIPSFTYRVINGRIAGRIDGLEAMKQAVEKLMQTERFIFPIYSEQYGHDLNELIGKELPYVEAVLEDILKDTLLFDDRVDDVAILSIQATGRQSLTVEVQVETFFGKFTIEMGVQA